MQQYIVIPEMPAIIRKIVPDGAHIAPFISATAAVSHHGFLVSGQVSETRYGWLREMYNAGIRSRGNA
jgi:hypothetical protein